MTKRDVGFDGLIVGGVILILIGIVSKIYWIAGIASGYLLLLGLGYLAARNEQKLEDAKKRLAGKQQVKGGECHEK